MIIFLYLLILLVGGYFILKALAPQLDLKFPLLGLSQIGRPKLRKDVANPLPVLKEDKSVLTPSAAINIPPPEVHEYSKADLLLVEKNKEIALLKEQLRVKQNQADDFEKLKSILDEEIVKLREQNRLLKTELSR